MKRTFLWNLWANVSQDVAYGQPAALLPREVFTSRQNPGLYLTHTY